MINANFVKQERTTLAVFLSLAYLFMLGSVSGWILEVLFRKFFSDTNPEHKWINPGFCTGPWLPLYGCGLCVLFGIASLERCAVFSDPVWGKALLLLLMALGMTAIEYIAGAISLHCFQVRLWDYRKEWGNLQGIICPKFSLFWAILAAVYYFLIHPQIRSVLTFLSASMGAGFFTGVFFGVFLTDVIHSAQLIAKLKRFAEDNNVIVRYEAIKAHIRTQQEKAKQTYHFFLPFRSVTPLTEHLKQLRESFEHRRKDHT